VIIAVDEVTSCLLYLRTLWRRERNLRLWLAAFFGKVSIQAIEAGMAIERRRG